MAEPLSAVDRIERAAARIEAATKALVASKVDLAARNQTLRESLQGAISTLDTIIEQRTPR